MDQVTTHPIALPRRGMGIKKILPLYDTLIIKVGDGKRKNVEDQEKFSQGSGF
jgi:hypothetical protein